MPLVDRFLLALRRMAAPWAVCYLALWALALSALAYEGPLQRALGCAADPHAPLPLWTCGESLVSTLAGVVVNAAFVAIIWSPFFVAAAFSRLDALPLVVITFGTHLAGMTGIFVLIVRAARRVGRAPRPA